jgi:hypothetical protein
VNFTSFIRVIPNITDLWTLTAACPCYDWDSGYTLTLSWPATAHPPWNATINITTDIILRDGSLLFEIVKGTEWSPSFDLIKCNQWPLGFKISKGTEWYITYEIVKGEQSLLSDIIKSEQ